MIEKPLSVTKRCENKSGCMSEEPRRPQGCRELGRLRTRGILSESRKMRVGESGS
jgi:hypothetical protein